MNVWKYTYIQFFKIRRRVIGKCGADDFAAMLFVVLLDCMFYWGIVVLADAFTGYHLVPQYEFLYAILFLTGAFIFGCIRNRSMCKGGAFDRIRKEVEAKPRKMLWGILSLLYILSAFAFFLLSVYLWGKKMLPVLVDIGDLLSFCMADIPADADGLLTTTFNSCSYLLQQKTPISVVLFFNCTLLLNCIWLLIRLYKTRTKKSVGFYVYGITALIGLFLGVVSFFHQECHAYCAIILGLLLFIDTYKEQKEKPVSKWSSAYASVISGYGFGIACIIYGLIRIYDIFTGCYH